jgi:hypothetical protein
MSGVPCDTALVVIDPPVSDEEIRRWHNAKDAPALYDLVTVAPRLPLGRVLDEEYDFVPGPAYRVFSLLGLRGTTPEYRLTMLDDELIREILAAYERREDDEEPATQRADPADVARFLAAHKGLGILAVDEDEP